MHIPECLSQGIFIVDQERIEILGWHPWLFIAERGWASRRYGDKFISGGRQIKVQVGSSYRWTGPAGLQPGGGDGKEDEGDAHLLFPAAFFLVDPDTQEQGDDGLQVAEQAEQEDAHPPDDVIR